MIELRKIDSENVWKIISLSVDEKQRNFVATNTESIIEAFTTITSGGEKTLFFGRIPGKW